MRRLLVLVYGLVFMDEIVLLAIIPLIPTFSDKLDLTKLQTGVLLAAAPVTTAIASLPAGLLADRVGARRLTLGAGAVLALSTAGQGLAGDFGSLLAARVGFGLASTTIWTAGIAWLSDSAPAERRSSAVAAVVAVAGVAAIVGPGFAGLLAEHSGVAVPFLATAVAAAAITLVLARSGPGGAADHEPPHPLETLRAAGADRVIFAAFVAMVIGGTADSVVNLLVPLQLAAHGLSSGSIGLAFSASGAIFLLVSALVARRGDRAAKLSVAGAATLALALSFVPVVIGTGTGPVIGAVLVRSPFLAALFTVAFPLGAEGARRAGIGRGTVIGLMSLGWGTAASVGPVVAGGLVQAAGERLVYGVVLGLCLAAAAWMLASARGPRAASPARAWTEPS